jgi:branched-chain amino acid transport system permease protein
VTDLLAFLIIVAVLFWHGSRIPGRGELVERRLPGVPRPRYLTPTSVILAGVAAVALVVLPFDFREALINTLIGTPMALSLVVITGFVEYSNPSHPSACPATDRSRRHHAG